MKLRGTSGHASAVGAQVRLRMGEWTQVQEVAIGGGFGSTNSLMLEFGLGEATVADEIEVSWPNGARRIIRDVDADQRILIVEAEPAFTQIP